MRGQELIRGVKEYLDRVFHRAPVDMGNNKITSLATPTADYDAATKKYVDDSAGGGATDHGALTGLTDDDHTQYHNDTRGDARYLKLAGGTMTGALDMDNKFLISPADPTTANHVGDRGYNDARYDQIGHTHTESEITDSSAIDHAAGRIYNTTDQSISATTYTEVAFGANEFSYPTGFADHTQNGFDIPYDGVYQFNVAFGLDSAESDVRVQVYKNGSAEYTNAIHIWKNTVNSQQQAYGTVLVDCTAGDVITMRLYAGTSTTIRGTTAIVRGYMEGHRVY